MQYDDASRVLDTKQVAELLQLDVDDVRRLTREGVLPWWWWRPRQESNLRA